MNPLLTIAAESKSIEELCERLGKLLHECMPHPRARAVGEHEHRGRASRLQRDGVRHNLHYLGTSCPEVVQVVSDPFLPPDLSTCV